MEGSSGYLRGYRQAHSPRGGGGAGMDRQYLRHAGGVGPHQRKGSAGYGAGGQGGGCVHRWQSQAERDFGRKGQL